MLETARGALSLLLLLLLCGRDAGFAALHARAASPPRQLAAVRVVACGSGSARRRSGSGSSGSAERTAVCGHLRRAIPRAGRGWRSRSLVACDGGDVDPDLASAWLDEETASPLADGGPEELSVAEAAALLREGGATLLDLRTHAEHCAARPAGALSHPAGDPGTLGLLFCFRDSFEEDVVARFSPTTPLILLCDVGVVSRIAAMRLLERAFASVRVVAGGFESWSLEAERPGAHLPIESGRPANADWPKEQGLAPTPSWEGSWDEEDEYLDIEALYAEMDGDATSAWSSVPPDASSAPVRPRPYGALYDPAHSARDSLEGELRNIGELGDDELGGDALDIEELEALLADSGAEEPLYADAAAEAAAMADEASATYEPAARGGKGAAVGAAEAAAMKTIPNALAGDQVDDDLASLVAKLDAPAELAPSRSAAKRVAAAAAADDAAAASAAAASAAAASAAAPAPSVAAPAAEGDGYTKKAAAKRAKRNRSGPPPAWFVNVDKVDFGGLLKFGKLGALSVKELKSFLYGREADISGTKKELVSRVEAELRRGDAGSGGGATGGDGNGGKSGGGAGGAGTGGAAAVAVARGASANEVKNGASKSLPRGRGAVGRGRGRASAGRGAGGDEAAELNTLAALPPPDGEDEPLSLFDSSPSTTDAADDFLIDEVFSAMY
eukprot:jgi/Chrpa1/18598/Chrysochromulina_OHIO_Genome00025822-RA